MTILLALWLSVVPEAAPAASAIRATTSARSIRPGEIVLFTLAVPEGTDTVRVRAFDRDIAGYRIDGTTWRAIVGVDLAVSPRTYPVAIEARGPSVRTSLTYSLRVRPRSFPTRRLRVADEFVNPPASELDRINREAAELAELWTHSSEQRLWSDPFVAPVPGKPNSAFGTRSFFNGRLRSRHSGGDFLSSQDTPAHAPGSGRVVLAEGLYFSGNTVVIDHGGGLFSLLAHLSEMAVQAGDRVRTGDVVGTVGATGRVTGPHLHWAVRANGARVDPLSLLAILGVPNRKS